MIVYRKDAGAYWCPFARVIGFEEESAANRTPGGDIREGSCCIGDQCMAWIWVDPADAKINRAGRCGLVPT